MVSRSNFAASRLPHAVMPRDVFDGFGKGTTEALGKAIAALC